MRPPMKARVPYPSSTLRHRVDDGAEPATFRVLCPRSGVVRDGMTIAEARALLDEHVAVCLPEPKQLTVDDVPW